MPGPTNQAATPELPGRLVAAAWDDMMVRRTNIAFLLTFLLSACASGPAANPVTPSPVATVMTPLRITPTSTTTPMPTASQKPMLRSTATPTPLVVGPDYVHGFNPLTGLPVLDPSALNRGPLLVSVTNFPSSARPQAGLPQAAHVWETSIGQGMTRFLAVYYGDYLEALSQAEEQRIAGDPYDHVIGPVRSGRVVYEDIKTLYPHAKLVIRNAAAEVLPILSDIVVLNAEDPKDVNSAGLRLSDLEVFPLEAADPADYAGLIFDARPPAGGKEARFLRIIFNLFNHVGWGYDPLRRVYLRYQDRADESGDLYPATDRLSGQQLAFENVVVLFADHEFENKEGTILWIGLALVRKHHGLLFRDGKWYDIIWATTHYRLQIQDRKGNPLPLKPGRTFFEVLSFESTWDEQAKLLRFHSPPLPTRPTGRPSTATATSVPSPVDTPTLTAPPPMDTPTLTPTPEP